MLASSRMPHDASLPRVRRMPHPTWTLDPDTIYLNHGSFGPSPDEVYHYQQTLQKECHSQPMRFFLRRLEPLWFAARDRLAQFLNCDPNCLIFSENATAGMNHLASFFPLEPNDEVLLNNHEYGVVKQIWRRACERASAPGKRSPLENDVSSSHVSYVEAHIPIPVRSSSQIIDAIAAKISPRTKLIVLSHITSPTAITFPVDAIVQLAKEHRIAICIDGPHAVLQQPIDLDSLGCDFYIASCHKWLCAPFGSGFTYVAPRWQTLATEPLMQSWGRLPPQPLEHWSHRYVWTGTRDYSPYLSIPKAIESFEEIGFDAVRHQNHALAGYARHVLTNRLGTEAVVPDDAELYSMMTAVFLPEGDHYRLQEKLALSHGIEVPIVFFEGRYLVRVSCHLYNSERDIDRLADALAKETGSV